jgi:hypothetical protein
VCSSSARRQIAGPRCRRWIARTYIDAATGIPTASRASLVCAGSLHEPRPELARSQQAVARSVALAEPAVHEDERFAGLPARDRFITEGATPPS